MIDEVKLEEACLHRLVDQHVFTCWNKPVVTARPLLSGTVSVVRGDSGEHQAAGGSFHRLQVHL